MLHRAARNAYSWWWASHIRTKQSKWLDENLQDMEEKVEYVLKIIDEDGDSFARRAEMYYKRRPELLNFVEDFFRSYRALAERFDHISKDLQTANRTIATVYPERVQLSMEDEDGEQFLAALGPPRESNEPTKNLPAAPTLNTLAKVPSFAKPNAKKPSRLMSKKGLIKFNVDEAVSTSSGLKKSEALKEIDRLQKEILALQTEKEFIKSSYENGLARYWEIEERVTEMQGKVSRLQDEFGIGTMIEDEEARTLMTATALNSCQETLTRLQEKQKQSVEDVIAEHQKILEVLGKFETLKGKFVSHLPHPQVLSEVNKSIKPDAELKKLNPQVEEVHHPKVKESQANSATSVTMSDLAEKVDELVDKIIYLESSLTSQNAYVNRLRAETSELHSHLIKAEEEKGTLIEDSESMSKRIRELEEELRVQNLGESIKHEDNLHQPHLSVKAYEAIIPGAKGVSSKESSKKEGLQEHRGRHEDRQQNLVESHLSNDIQDGLTGGTTEANQDVSGADKAKKFSVHEAIIPGANFIGTVKGLKKEDLQEQEGSFEEDQQHFVESNSRDNTRDGQTGGTLEANQRSGLKTNKYTGEADATKGTEYTFEGKDEKLPQGILQNDQENFTTSVPAEDAAGVVIEHGSATRKSIGKVEQRGTNDLAERRDEFPLPSSVEDKREKQGGTRAIAEKSDRMHSSDNVSAIREERTEELAVKDAPHADMEESDRSQLMSSSHHSAPLESVGAEQKSSRTGMADTSSTSKDGKSFSKEGSYFNDLLQRSPSGATLDDTSGRGSKEDVHTMSAPHRDSIFLKDTEIQLKKLEHDPFNSTSGSLMAVKPDESLQQSNWHSDIPRTATDSELEEWERLIDNLPSVLRDNKGEDLHKDEFPDQGKNEDSRKQVFKTVDNGLFVEQDESGIEDDQPNWRELFLNSLDDREKILLEEYTSVLRNFKGVKKKLNDAEKTRRASHFQYVVQMKVLKNANALKDAQILSLQHRLNSIQSKDVETNEMQKEATLQDADIGEDDREAKVTDDDAHSFTSVEEKVRMDIDDLLEENIELWLRFSTSFHLLQKFQTSVQDLQDDIKKVKEECKDDQPQSLLTGIRPIYRHLREIQTELSLWLDHNAMLKDDLQHRLSSLSNILDVLTRLSKSGSKESEPVLNAYQAAKFQGEIMNMKQENNKLAGELEHGFESIRKLQHEIQTTLSNLDEELGLKNQQTRPRSRIPLRSFLFGVKLKKQRPSLFACVNPALQKQYSDL